eukprot:gene9752-11977_t
MSTEKQVWFITGASKGLGLAFVKGALNAGHKVVATSRNKEQLNQLVEADSDRFLALKVDLSNEDSVKESIDKAVAKFSRLDVIVNNAGYGLFGAVEELSNKELHDILEINVFGVLNVLRHVTPVLRNQKSGYVFNISSIAGFSGSWPGLAGYTASKFGLDGLTESYAAEVKLFGIRASTINPGYFRTEFLSNDSMEVAKNNIPEYTNVKAVIDQHKNHFHHKQIGDPKKLFNLLEKLVNHKGDVPIHVFAGSDSTAMAKQKIELLQKEIKEWEEFATATDYDESA